MTTRKGKLSVVEPSASKPLYVVVSGFLRMTGGDVLRFWLGWELFFKQSIVWIEGDTSKPYQTTQISVTPVPPQWWERVRKLLAKVFG